MKQMKDFFKNLSLTDWKVHLIALGILIVSEAIGTMSFTIKLSGSESGITFSMFAMLYAIIIGIILNGAKKITPEQQTIASPYIGISSMLLITKMASSIGPAWDKIVVAGPALILQEFGNLGTAILALPIAVFIFGMGRAAVGATFSISREPSLAIIADKYGLDSAEGTGVMGAYITGTVLGTVFNGIMVSALITAGWFHPYALAMAAGTGSSSMMSAALAPIVEAFPAMEAEITAYAATSQTLTSADGIYMSLLLGIPMTNLLYKLFRGDKIYEKRQARRAAKAAKNA